MLLEKRNIRVIKIIVYLILSLGWLAIAHYAGRLIPNQQLWFALLTTFLFGLPLFLAGAYAVTIQRIYYSPGAMWDESLYRFMCVWRMGCKPREH